MPSKGLPSLIVAAGVMLAGQLAMAAPETVNFSNVTGGSISFVGTGSTATFTFPPTATPDLKITSIANFTTPGDLLTGLQGNIEGTFSYNTSDIKTFSGGTEIATVTGSAGQFVINDGAGYDFTARILWNTITAQSSVSGVSSTAKVSLDTFAYQGGNAQLKELYNAVTGSINASFNFNPNMDLFQLASTTCSSSAPCATNFSGALTASATPEPSWGAFLLIGMLGVFGVARRSVRKRLC